MFNHLLLSIRSLLSQSHHSNEKISCYHCGEKSTPRRTIYVYFDGNERAVCCNGCATILRTVDELEMREEYLAHKIHIHPPS